MATTVKRQIVMIDEDKCNGCGLCVTACHEGALQLIDGKARLVRDDYCDGLGACLGECPQGAITIIEREAAPFDEAAVEEHLAKMGRAHEHAPAQAHGAPSGCPSVAAIFTKSAAQEEAPCGCPSANARVVSRDVEASAPGAAPPSALRNWPTQLKLVPPQAPYLQGADLLISADCVPFAYGGFHTDLLPGKVVLQACPKLDDVDFYRTKLAAIIAGNDVRSVTVARMEVPCCGGLVAVVRDAVAASGKDIPVEVVVVGIEGEVLRREPALAHV